jgi:hypothetical protein
MIFLQPEKIQQKKDRFIYQDQYYVQVYQNLFYYKLLHIQQNPVYIEV